jgi:ATP-binding cassette subfamily C protein CydD
MLFPLIAAVALIFQQKQIAYFVNGIIFLGIPVKNFTNTLIIVFVIILLRMLFTFFGEIISKELALKVKKIIRENLIHQIIQKNISSLNSGEVVNLLLDKVEVLEDYFSKFIPQVFLSIFIPVSILIFVFPLDFLTAIIFIITAPLIPFFMVLIGKFAEKVTKEQWHSLNKLSIFFLDSIRGIKTIIQFNQRDEHLHRIKQANKDFIDKSMSVLRVTFLSAFVLELISTLSIAVIAVEIGLRLLYFQITFEQAFFILLVAPEFYLPLRNLGLRFHAALNGIEAYRDIHQFTRFNLPNIDQKEKKKLVNDIKKIEIKNVSYKYPTSNKHIFDDFSFTFESGKHYCIAGPNGSGKTTFFKLLLNLLKPDTGRIIVNSLNLKDLDQIDFYQQIGWLPQNPAIFKGSFFENIAIANSALTVEKANDLLQIINLGQFVDSLPENIHTEIQEFGNTISSGQRQKIGIARILARDVSLILCDEPTSSLDPESKKSMLELINEIGKEKILITIAHDLQTIKSAEEILFFEPGFPVLSGEFNTLISTNERFGFYVDQYFRGF